MSRRDQIQARLAELSGASADTLKSALTEFDVRDIIAVLAADTQALQLMGPYALTAAMVADNWEVGGSPPAGSAVVPLGYTPDDGTFIHDYLWFTSEDWDQGANLDSGEAFTPGQSALNVGDDALNTIGTPLDTFTYAGQNVTYSEENSSELNAELVAALSTANVIMPVKVTTGAEVTAKVNADDVTSTGHTDFYFLVSHATLAPLPTGPKGDTGNPGAAGVGVPTGGTTGQVLAKNSNTNYDTEWTAAGAGGGTPPLKVVTVNYDDILPDQLGDGSTAAPLVTVPAGSVFTVIGIRIVETFDDTDAANPSPQVVDGGDQVALWSGSPDLSAATSSSGADFYTYSIGDLQYSTIEQPIWLLFSAWSFDGTQGSLEVLLLVETST